MYVLVDWKNGNVTCPYCGETIELDFDEFGRCRGVKRKCEHFVRIKRRTMTSGIYAKFIKGRQDEPCCGDSRKYW